MRTEGVLKVYLQR